MRPNLISLLLLGLLLLPASPALADGSWLDTTLTNWNASRQIPAPPTVNDTITLSADDPHCAGMFRAAETSEDQQLVAAGWHLYTSGPTVYYYSSGAGKTVVLGTAAYDGMCRPWDYQAFVFVDGSFAGTLSPVPMDARFDGDLDNVRIVDDTVVAGFEHCSRNATAGDAPCSPTFPTFVSYAMESDEQGPLLVPMYVNAVDSVQGHDESSH